MTVTEPQLPHPSIAILAFTLVAVPSIALAQTASSVGSTERAASDAQPGIHRVAFAQPTSPTVAATVGYGYTESQRTDDGSHHRLSLRLAAAASVVPWLNLGAIASARYDAHPNDSGTILDGALSARLGTRLGRSFVGAEVKGWLPGSEQLTLSATSLDTRALFAQSFGFGTIAMHAGYRWDNGAKAGNSAPRLSYADRLALSLSEFDAILLGAGAIVPIHDTHLLMEVSGDLLVGQGAPSVARSPIRATAGVRQLLTHQLSLDVLVDASFSGRPEVSSTAPLVPIEPRVSGWLGIRYRFAKPEVPPAAAPLPPPVESKPPEPPKVPLAAPPPAPDSELEVVVADDQGSAVVNAKLKVAINGAEYELRHTEAGHYRAQQLPAGEGELTIEAEGLEPVRQSVSIKSGAAPVKLPVQLKAVPPSSQVRGVVRSFGGKGVSAKIHVDPLGVDTTTDASGAFQLDVLPGDYEVVIEAEGFATQRRRVHVDPQGVVIINADLVKKR